ncbi:MAG: dihydrodipicolinate synthase family protein [Rhodospirillales bacterium]|jgi:4-hydroxy-tetrahydrodipicolinate synthase|nr:dihydrodipicolinate synthase family protein [Rhodospirillales bacterium]
MKQFRGSFPVIVTPFRASDSAFDEDAMRRFVDWQIEQGCHGLVTLGSMGEFYLVSDEERTRIVTTVVEQVAGRVPLLVGTMNIRNETAVRYSREAEELGADGLMITPPYYTAPTDDEIFDYYRDICEEVSIPVMLYNNPFTTNVDMSAALVGRLTREFENVRYIKEASGDLARVYDIRREAGPKMNVWQGARPFEAFSLGSNGWVSPEGNWVPAATAEMYNRLFAGDTEGAEILRDRFVAMVTLIRSAAPAPRQNNLAVVTTFAKELCAMVGQPMGVPRAPMKPVAAYGERGAQVLAQLRDILDEMGVLTAQAAE